MAVVPVCYKMPYKDNLFSPQSSVRHHGRGVVPVYLATGILLKTKTRVEGGVLALKVSSVLHRVWNIKGEDSGMELNASKTSTTEKRLRLLDSYFGLLHGDSNQPSSSIASDDTAELLKKTKQINTMEELESLNSYLGKLNKDANLKNYESSSLHFQATKENSGSINDNYRRGDKSQKSFIKTRKMNVNTSTRTQTLQQNDETSDLYLISLLISIDIAVFLFEIASPVKNSDFELFSLPLLYGAKINDLILVGEWWRLVTPMFLHSGVFHVGLGCWSLVTFGPAVCRGYGSFTFFLIYMLGGISGNLTSFLHTSEPTVGGTGPVFAIIGAWLVYQMQNKGATAKDVTDIMFQKAIITTGLCFILSHFGPIDDWTHLGAIITGIVYGFFTCPTLQLDNASSSTSAQDEGIAVVRQYTNPCKSLAVFAVCILFLSSLLFLVEPPLHAELPEDSEWFFIQDALL